MPFPTCSEFAKSLADGNAAPGQSCLSELAHASPRNRNPVSQGGGIGGSPQRISGGWAIVDPYGQPVSAASELGQKIVAAIAKASGASANGEEVLA